MRLENDENTIIVWETGSQNNSILYNSDDALEDISTRRKSLSGVEIFLRSKGEGKEADRIKEHLGKIIHLSTIPQIVPTGNYRINSRLEYLDDTIGGYIKDYNLDLDPEFQRGHVWSEEQRIRYIEFILQGGKSNPIYFNHANWMSSFEGEMVLVDGKQRLTSLLDFLDNKILVFKELDPEGIGYKRSEFDHIAYDIEIVINNLKSHEQVLLWYLQMNTGNVAHTEEEIQRVENLLLEEIDKKKRG